MSDSSGKTAGSERVSLVTGGSSGIGRHVALALADLGHHVVVSSHNLDRASVVAGSIRDSGGRASAIVADLLDPNESSKLVANVIESCGRLDHLVSSGAGFSPSGFHFKLFHEMDAADFDGLANAHWLSKARLIRAALQPMIEAGYGKIVNVSTDAGRFPTPNESMIGGAAAGLMLMSRAVAREVGRYGVRINTVSLGPLADLDLSEVVAGVGDAAGVAGATVADGLRKRLLFPVGHKDIATTVRFLLDVTGDNITGQTFSVNGGVSTH